MKKTKKLVAIIITLVMVLSLSAAPTFAAAKTPKTSITAASVYYNNNAKITWKKAAGAVKYKVYRKSADEKAYKLITTTTRNFYRSEDLQYNTKYSYKIKAVNKSGKGQYSAVKSITTKKAVGTPVKIVKSDVGCDRDCMIKWDYDQAEKNVVSYSIMRRTASSGYLKLDTIKCSVIDKDRDMGEMNGIKYSAIPQKTTYPYTTVFYDKAGKDYIYHADNSALVFVDWDNMGTALRKKVDNQAKINKAYNTYYYYKIIAKYEDGSVRASKTVKIKTTKAYDPNKFGVTANYDLFAK